MRKNCFKSVIALCLIAMFSFMINGNSKAYGTEAIPKIQKIVLEYENVREGDTQTIDIASRAFGKVQYRVWVASKKTGVWQDITKGFTKPMAQNEILSITTPKLKEGDYTVSVWVKRAGAKAVDRRGFDTYSAVSMKCLKKDGQTPNVKLENIKYNYSKGQLVEVKKQEGKNYFYKYSVYNVLKNKAVVSYGKDYVEGFSWKAAEDGMYLLKVKLKSIEKVEVVKEDESKVEDKKVDEKDDKLNNEAIKEEVNKEIDSQKEQTEVKEDKVVQENKSDEVKGSSNDVSIVKDVETNKEENNNIASENKESADKSKSTELKEDIKEDTNKDVKKVEYKEVVTEEEVTKLIIVGNPYVQPVVPPVTPKDTSIYVGNVSETSKLYIRSQPSTSSSIIGYIYGSLQSINVIKRVGAYSYIETTDYGTLRKVRGYVPSSYIKKVQPRKDYSIIVDLSDQYVYVYKNGKLFKRIVCSTGQNATPTPVGTYIVGSRGSYFLTGYKSSIKCYNWVRFNYNFLFHSVLCTKSGQPLQSAVSQLGHKASHGCVRLPLSDSKWFYNTIPAGTLVTIRP